MSAHLETPHSERPVKQAEDDRPVADELLNLFGDEYTRRVFKAISDQPRCGRAVAEAADVSRATAYRRLNDLCDAGLAKTEMVINEDGNHHERYKAIAETLSVSLDGNRIKAEVTLTD